MKSNMTAAEYKAHVELGMSEKQLQASVVRTLGTLGYHTPNWYVEARVEPSVEHGIIWQTMDGKANTNTAGLPDLVIKPKGKVGVIGIELKRPNGKGKLSMAQAVATKSGAYQIAKSVDEVLAIVERAEGKRDE